MDVLPMTFLWAQRKLYEAFLKSELVDLAIQPKKSLLVDSAIQPKRSPLTAITVRSPSNLFFYSDIVYLPWPSCFLLPWDL